MHLLVITKQYMLYVGLLNELKGQNYECVSVI
jgi:hypothetical protein